MASSNVVPEWFSAIGTKNNYNTMVYYAGKGTDTFEFNFQGGYINQSDIKAFMIHDVTRENVGLTLTFINQNTVKTNRVVPVQWTVCIFRDTPKARPLAKFVDGAVINAFNLDRNAQQAVFSVAEMVDRFDSTTASVEQALKDVYAANLKSDQAIQTANNAKSTADGAVVTANAASKKADQAINTANGAVGTANAASTKADGAIKTANEAKATANAIDGKVNQANATSNEAKQIAQGIDAKATAAIATANAANTKADKALATANGVDGKATKALADSKTALDKATAVENESAKFTPLTTRIKSFDAGDGITWKGKHTFPGIFISPTDKVYNVPYLDFMPTTTPPNGIQSLRKFRNGGGGSVFHEILNNSTWEIWTGLQGNKLQMRLTDGVGLDVAGQMSTYNVVARGDVTANGVYRTNNWWGGGGWGTQLNDRAPYAVTQNGTTDGDSYFPLIKGYTRRSNGYPTAVSFGTHTLPSGFAEAVIHVAGDNNKQSPFSFTINGDMRVPNVMYASHMTLTGNATSNNLDVNTKATVGTLRITSSAVWGWGTAGAGAANDGNVYGTRWGAFSGKPNTAAWAADALQVAFNAKADWSNTGHDIVTRNIDANDVKIRSDIRHKRNLVEVGGLDALSAITGYSYEVRKDSEDGERWDESVGVIAQSVQAVCPEAVGTGPDGTLTLNYNAVIAILVNSVKELRAEVQELKNGN